MAVSTVMRTRHLSAGELVADEWPRDRRLSFAHRAEVSSRANVAARGSTRHAHPRLAGPPKSFPYLGARDTAWTSHPDDRRPVAIAHFVEVAPAVSIRIFETSGPGAVMAVEAETSDGETLALYAGPPNRRVGPHAVATVFEVALPAPRSLRMVTIKLDPDGHGPVGVDAVALVHADAVAPVGTDWTQARRQRSVRRTALTHLAIALPILAIGVFAFPDGDPLPKADMIANATASTIPRASLDSTAVRWANKADIDASTPPAIPGYEAIHAVGAPDSRPKSADAVGATWSPPQDGAYHRELARLSLAFGPDCVAKGLIVIENFGSGALRAIDVAPTGGGLVRIHTSSAGSAPTAKGAPRTFPADGVRAPGDHGLLFTFAEPITVGRAVLYFDPRQVPGTVAIDAVGLVPVDPMGCQPVAPSDD